MKRARIESGQFALDREPRKRAPHRRKDSRPLRACYGNRRKLPRFEDAPSDEDDADGVGVSRRERSAESLPHAIHRCSENVDRASHAELAYHGTRFARRFVMPSGVV